MGILLEMKEIFFFDTSVQKRKQMAESISILHFADAHIDMANYGRHDPQTALPIRVMDFLKSLDTVIQTAIDEKVKLVLFAGDTYKDRNPHPTFQREWQLRMMRLSQANIPALLLVGNHDVSPATGRSHTLQEFKTLKVPHIFVADELALWTPDQLGVPLQVITLPWVSRSAFMTRKETSEKSSTEVLQFMEQRILEHLQKLLSLTHPEYPVILLAHASVQGAHYSSERLVMLGQDIVLPLEAITRPPVDYVALGHIHKHQSLHAKNHPPVIYPGSLERINFSESKEEKGFVLASVSRGQTIWEFRPLQTRKFLEVHFKPTSSESFLEEMRQQLPSPQEIQGAVCRLHIHYPKENESFFDENILTKYFQDALSFQIQKYRQFPERVRLEKQVEALKPEDILSAYWKLLALPEEEQLAMKALAKQVFSEISESF